MSWSAADYGRALNEGWFISTGGDILPTAERPNKSNTPPHEFVSACVNRPGADAEFYKRALVEAARRRITS